MPPAKKYQVLQVFAVITLLMALKYVMTATLSPKPVPTVKKTVQFVMPPAKKYQVLQAFAVITLSMVLKPVMTVIA